MLLVPNTISPVIIPPDLGKNPSTYRRFVKSSFATGIYDDVILFVVNDIGFENVVSVIVAV